MVDLVKPLKFENPNSGTQTNFRPTELDPDEDYVTAKGFSFEKDKDIRIDLDTNGDLQYRDVNQTTPKTFKSIVDDVSLNKTKLDSLLLTKSGQVAQGVFSGNPKKADVTFTTPFTNNNYSISIIGGDSRSWSYESKSGSGFTINANANQNLTQPVLWIAIAQGETI